MKSKVCNDSNTMLKKTGRLLTNIAVCQTQKKTSKRNTTI